MQGTTPGRFGYPTDVVLDRAGNFYVSEYGENDRIQVFSPDGSWLRQWGGHGYAPGEFLRPRALAMDDDDQLYVADSCNHRIQVFDTDGKLLRVWGDRGAAAGQMSYPYDLALGPGGHALRLRVRQRAGPEIHPRRQVARASGAGSGREPGRLNNPWALAVDGEGEVSVVDSNNHRVQRFRF